MADGASAAAHLAAAQRAGGVASGASSAAASPMFHPRFLSGHMAPLHRSVSGAAASSSARSPVASGNRPLNRRPARGALSLSMGLVQRPGAAGSSSLPDQPSEPSRPRRYSPAASPSFSPPASLAPSPAFDARRLAHGQSMFATSAAATATSAAASMPFDLVAASLRMRPAALAQVSAVASVSASGAVAVSPPQSDASNASMSASVAVSRSQISGNDDEDDKDGDNASMAHHRGRASNDGDDGGRANAYVDGVPAALVSLLKPVTAAIPASAAVSVHSHQGCGYDDDIGDSVSARIQRGGGGSGSGSGSGSGGQSGAHHHQRAHPHQQLGRRADFAATPVMARGVLFGHLLPEGGAFSSMPGAVDANAAWWANSVGAAAAVIMTPKTSLLANAHAPMAASYFSAAPVPMSMAAAQQPVLFGASNITGAAASSSSLVPESPTSRAFARMLASNQSLMFPPMRPSSPTASASASASAASALAPVVPFSILEASRAVRADERASAADADLLRVESMDDNNSAALAAAAFQNVFAANETPMAPASPAFVPRPPAQVPPSSAAASSPSASRGLVQPHAPLLSPSGRPRTIPVSPSASIAQRIAARTSPSAAPRSVVGSSPSASSSDLARSFLGAPQPLAYGASVPVHLDAAAVLGLGVIDEGDRDESDEKPSESEQRR